MNGVDLYYVSIFWSVRMGIPSVYRRASLMIRSIARVKLKPDRSTAAKNPPSGDRQGFVFTSSTQGLPVLSIRKSTLAYPRRPNIRQHLRAKSDS